LTVANQIAILAAVALSGDGVLVASGDSAENGAGEATLEGSGSLVAAAFIAATRAVLFSGTGQLGAVGRVPGAPSGGSGGHIGIVGNRTSLVSGPFQHIL
jgi:hypothetical protein